MNAEGVQAAEIARKLGIGRARCIGCWVSRTPVSAKRLPYREPAKVRSRSTPAFDQMLNMPSRDGSTSRWLSTSSWRTFGHRLAEQQPPSAKAWVGF